MIPFIPRRVISLQKSQVRIGTVGGLASYIAMDMEPSTSVPEPENRLSAFVNSIPNEVQVMVENMLNMINGIKEHSDVIEEEIEKCKDSALQRKKTLDEEKEHFQKVASAVLDMLTKSD